MNHAVNSGDHTNREYRSNLELYPLCQWHMCGPVVMSASVHHCKLKHSYSTYFGEVNAPSIKIKDLLSYALQSCNKPLCSNITHRIGLTSKVVNVSSSHAVGGEFVSRP